MSSNRQLFIHRDPFCAPLGGLQGGPRNRRPQAAARHAPWAVLWLLLLAGALATGIACIGGCARSGAGGDTAARQMAGEIEQSFGGRGALKHLRYLRFDYVVTRNGHEVERRVHLWDRRTGRYRLEGREGGVPFITLFNVNTKQGKSFSGLTPELVADSGPSIARAVEAYQHDTDWLLGGLRLRERGTVLHDTGAQVVAGGAVSAATTPAATTAPGSRAIPTLGVEFPRGTGLANGAGQAARYWFYLNPADRRPYAWAVSEPGQSGPPVVYRWAAWHDIAGLNLPIRFERQGGEAWAITIDRLYAPKNVPRELFETIDAPIYEKIHIQPGAAGTVR